jgi:glycosyltransferase involved in cell wall biosynthesis
VVPETATPSPPTLCVLVPCFNEVEVLEDTALRLSDLMDRWRQSGLVSQDSFVLFVDDGSEDKTWDIIRSLVSEVNNFAGLRLGMNAGHQAALSAGFQAALPFCELFVSIDADLQDDPTTIEVMLSKVSEGAEVVLGVRSDRTTDSFYKRASASLFYRLSQSLGVPTVRHHADFRMMTTGVVQRILASRERKIYWRAASLTVTQRVAIVEYARQERPKGRSKYTGRKMLTLALGALTSWSSAPLRVISLVGIFVSSLSFLALIYVLLSFLMGRTVSGWVSLASSVYFLFGVTIFALGTLGEYLKQVLEQVRGRPPFHISERVGLRKSSD